MRALLILGGLCLALALALTLVCLPQAFTPLSGENFQSHILNSTPKRDGIELAKSQHEFEGKKALIIEWRPVAQ